MRISPFLLACTLLASTSLAAPIQIQDQNAEMSTQGLVDTLADVLNSLLGIKILSGEYGANGILTDEDTGYILAGGDGGGPNGGKGGGPNGGGDGGGPNGGKGGGPNGGGDGGGPNGGKGGGPNGGGDGGGPNGGKGGGPNGGGDGGGPNGGKGGGPDGGGSGGGPPSTPALSYENFAKEIFGSEYPVSERYFQIFDTDDLTDDMADDYHIDAIDDNQDVDAVDGNQEIDLPQSRDFIQIIEEVGVVKV